jgi:hypothetical protein
MQKGPRPAVGLSCAKQRFHIEWKALSLECFAGRAFSNPQAQFFQFVLPLPALSDETFPSELSRAGRKPASNLA